MRTISFLIFFLFFAPTTFAETVDEVVGMSLEELMGVKVSVVSKQDESQFEAPGIVSVVSKEDIGRLGALHLIDLLGRLPGISLPGVFYAPQGIVGVRGQEGSQTFVLVLLNGRPLRESAGGGYINDILSAFPLSAVERLEVIRGPGSVLYGSNAVAGVVNIVTKTGGKENSVALTRGSFDTSMAEVSLGHSGEEWDVHLGARGYDSDGWNYDLNFPLLTGRFATGSGPFWMEQQSAHLGLNYKNFEVNVLSTHRDLANFEVGSSFPIPRLHEVRKFVDVGYHAELSEHWRIQNNVSYSHMSMRGSRDRTAKDIIAESTVSGDIGEALQLQLGAVIERKDGEDRFAPYEYTETWLSGYAQLHYELSEMIKIVSGVQYNKPDGVDADFSPRTGVVMQFSPRWGVKLLYGEAFRSPGASDRFSRIGNVFFGNPLLEPQTVGTADAQVYYQHRAFYFALTAFHSKYEGRYDVVSRPDGTFTYENTGSDTFKGFEAEGRYAFSSRFDILANVSYQDNENERGEESLTSSVMANIGMNYKPSQTYSFSFNNKYISDPGLSTTSKSTKAYHHLTVRAACDLRRLLRKYDWPTVELSVYGDNLLESDSVYGAEPQVSDPLPRGPGRAVYASVRVVY